MDGTLILVFVCQFQFSYGGPIIAFQVENEYGSFGENLSVEYMTHLTKVSVWTLYCSLPKAS